MFNSFSSNLSIEDIIIILLYLILCLAIGLNKMGKIKDIRTYALGYIGSESITTTMLVTTLFSSYIGARMTVGIIGRIYDTGLVYGLSQLVRPIFWLATAVVFAKNIHKFKGCISLSDIMEKMYGDTGKWVINILYFPLSCGILSAQVLAMGTMFQYFIGTSQLIGILCGMAVLIIYSTLGGVKAVIITDFAQFIILFIAFPVCTYIVYNAAGGWDAISAALPATHNTIEWNSKNTTEFTTFLFHSILPCTAGTYIQRLLISGNSQQVKTTMKINFLLTIPLVFFLLIIALSVKSIAPNLERSDTAMFYAIDNFLPAGVRGLVIAGILAVIMSSADSWLNTAGVMFAHDIAKKINPQISDKRELQIAKWTSAIMGIIAIISALKAKDLLSLLWTIDNFWDPMVLVPLCAGFMGMKISHKEFKIGILASAIGVVLSAKLLRDGYDIITLTIGIFCNFAGIFLTRLYYKNSSKDKDEDENNSFTPSSNDLDSTGVSAA